MKKEDKWIEGYHYTSHSNWLKIKQEGLIPYPINKPEVTAYFSEPVKGIFTWIQDLVGKSHAGSVLYQVAYRGEPKIVKLKYRFKRSEVLRKDGSVVQLSHGGHIQNWNYHDYSEQAMIVTNRIPPRRIELVKVYDVQDLLK